jgi:hypothetical protein
MPVILAALEAEIRKIVVQGQLVQKVRETPPQPIKSWAWWCTPIIPAIQEV